MPALLTAYLDRIGHPEVTGPDLPTLHRIVAAHARAIAFENLDPFTGREVDLAPAAIAAKLVHGGRGGWCYEQNLLLAEALTAIGYTTTGHAARVLWGRPVDLPLPARSHMLLRVDLPEGPHIVDVGFGGLTLTGALALRTGIEQETPHETFRLREADANGHLLQVLIGQEWRPVYWFDGAEQVHADYERSSWYLCHHPDSHFRNGLMIARPEPGRRFALAGTSLTVYHQDGPAERRELTSPAEIRKVLEETFLLDTSGLPDLETQLQRLFGTAL